VSVTVRTIRDLSPSHAGTTLVWCDEPVMSYRVDVTCPQCGADVVHVAPGRKTWWRQVSALKCSECNWNGAVTVDLSTLYDGRHTAAKRRVAVGV
jgi:predicted RNA-binding Zn-ribbon protein involved in translation (DUF1610 family)